MSHSGFCFFVPLAANKPHEKDQICAAFIIHLLPYCLCGGCGCLKPATKVELKKKTMAEVELLIAAFGKSNSTRRKDISHLLGESFQWRVNTRLLFMAAGQSVGRQREATACMFLVMQEQHCDLFMCFLLALGWLHGSEEHDTLANDSWLVLVLT